MSTEKKKNIPLIEKLLFSQRPFVLGLFFVLTVVFGFNMLQLKPEASFLRMIPTYHPYIQNYIAHQNDLKGLGNTLRIAVCFNCWTGFSIHHRMRQSLHLTCVMLTVFSA